MPRSLTTHRALGTALIVLAAAWAVIRSGVSVSPGMRDAHLTALIWPQALGQGLNDFYVDSALGIFVYRALRLTTQHSFLLLSVATTIIAITALVVWAARTVPNGSRSRASRLVLLAPLPAVLFTWLGFYDAFTVLAWAVALFAWSSGSRPLMVIAGTLLGLQHFEQALAGLVALTLTWFAVRGTAEFKSAPLNSRNPLWVLPGVLLGKLVLVLAITAGGGEASGRTSGIGLYLREWMVTALNTAPILLWSLFAGTWALVVAWWLHEPKWRRRWWIFAAVGVGLTALLLSGDRPRVFVLVMAPALLLLTVSMLSSNRLSPRSWRLVEVIVWLAPPIALWGTSVSSQIALDHLIMTWAALTGG